MNVGILREDTKFEKTPTDIWIKQPKPGLDSELYRPLSGLFILHIHGGWPVHSQCRKDCLCGFGGACIAFDTHDQLRIDQRGKQRPAADSLDQLGDERGLADPAPPHT